MYLACTQTDLDEYERNEWTFRSPRLNAGGRSLKSFAGVFSQQHHPRVCLAASAQDVQSKCLFASCALGITVLLFPLSGN
ncbi:hypothetical protein P692DRAFT_20840172 [Suillus brevipes Sb2]|nr:hypothetical protein P692DRAFT_20840172 [Suillus brevipes Sb2]